MATSTSHTNGKNHRAIVLYGTDISEISVDPAPSTPEEFGAFIRSETDKWRVVFTEAGVSLK